MRKRNPKKQKIPRSLSLAPEREYTSYNNLQLTFLKPRQVSTMRYVGHFTTTLLTMVASNQIMNLNSIFDPDRTGAGHFPYGYATIIGIYNRYRVIKTWWKVCFSPSTASYDICVVPTNGALATAVTTQLTWEQAAANPRALLWNLGASGTTKEISSSVALNSLNGVSIIEYKADDRFESQVASSPTELMVLNVCTFNPNGGTIVINFFVELTFEVDLHDLIAVV